MTDPLAPQGVVFRPVSPKLATVRVISELIVFIPFITASLIGVIMLTKWLWIATAALTALLIWSVWIVVRQVRAMGFALNEDEFLIRKGIMFKHLTLIPYGRIQYVEVSEGPIARMFNVAELRLHTASPVTNAILNGVPSGEAARLRDMLVERGSGELAGL